METYRLVLRKRKNEYGEYIIVDKRNRDANYYSNDYVDCVATFMNICKCLDLRIEYDSRRKIYYGYEK